MSLTDHANIVQYIDFESIEGRSILVMELCDESLADRVGKNGLEYYDFMRLCKQLGAAIQHLRQIDIVHRDIKPENVLVTKSSDGEIIYKLGDFGAARELKPQETYNSLYGTFEFAHPDIFHEIFAENLTADKQRDPNIKFYATHDLWSIGATLYFAATAEVPFFPKKGRNDDKCMYRMITEKKSSDIRARESLAKEIIWSSQLPAKRFSNTQKKSVEPYLAGLMNVRFQ